MNTKIEDPSFIEALARIGYSAVRAYWADQDPMAVGDAWVELQPLEQAGYREQVRAIIDQPSFTAARVHDHLIHFMLSMGVSAEDDSSLVAFELLDADMQQAANTFMYSVKAMITECSAGMNDLGVKNIDNPIEICYATLKKQMQCDPSYAWAWHCNIAMPILDSTKGALTHAQANVAAAHLMNHLFDIDTLSLPEFKSFWKEPESTEPEQSVQSALNSDEPDVAMKAEVKGVDPGAIPYFPV